MKVYIAQGGGLSRLVKSDNDTEKNLYWLKKEIHTYINFIYPWILV